MKKITRLSIKNRLRAVVIFVTLSTGFIGFSIAVYFHARSSKKEIISNLDLKADILGQNSIQYIINSDKDGAKSSLDNLIAKSSIVKCEVYDKDMRVLTSYYNRQKEAQNISLSNNYITIFRGDYIHIVRPINNKKINYGYIYIVESIDGYKSSLRKYMWTLIPVVIVLLSLSILLSNFLLKFISKPVEELSKFTERISKTADNSLRFPETKARDEISMLYKGFNRMLEQISYRENERDIAEKELAKQRIKAEAAEEADKLKSAFLANMSHEIRTPMNAIVGFSNLLRDEDTTEEEKGEYIEIINKSGENLLHLIDDIIDISKIEAGQLMVKMRECPINKTLREIFLMFNNGINKGKEGVAILMNIPEKDNEIVIKTDAYRFKQVMINLISNALKFTEKGTVEFGYIIEKQDAGHSTQEKFIRFYVKDTGIGIPKDSLLEIFERFKKLEDKRTKLYRGAGLGLAISKNLVELMGGSIWAESEEGKGATFSFSLPYQSLEIKEEKKPKENNGDSKYIWEDKTILVVEDEDFVCKFYGRILGPTKATVIWANNGLQAVEACRSNDKINVVLMDMKLPEISGYEATRRIKTFRKHLPIIAQTAYAMSEDRSLCLEAGCDDYITKPIDPLILLNKIHNALNHGRGN